MVTYGGAAGELCGSARIKSAAPVKAFPSRISAMQNTVR